MALTSDRPIDRIGGNFNALPVKGATIIYAGAFVGDDGSGFARPLEAGDVFLGIAVNGADNSGGADGVISVELYNELRIEHVVAGAAGPGNLGGAVYATSDDGLATAGNALSVVGKVHRHVSGSTCIVSMKSTVMA